MKLLSVTAVAERVGVSRGVVAGWVKRSDDPLPAVPVGKSGRIVKVIEGEIEPWLIRQAGGAMR